MPKAAGVAEATAPAPEPAAEEAKPKATKTQRVTILSQGRKLDEATEFVNAAIIGDSGTGKTTDLMRMANLGPIIVINAESGVKRTALKRMGVDVSNITVLPEKPEDLTFKYLEDLYWELAAKLHDDPDYIAGTVWDSITEIHKVLLRNVVDYQIKRATARGESRIKNAAPGDMLNDSFIDLSDYGIMTDQVRTLIRRYRDLPCHFGMSATLRRDLDEQDGKVVYNPAVNPAVGNDMQGQLDIIIVKSLKEFDDDGDDEYQGLTRPVGKYRGKDRFKVLPKRMVDPFFDKVVGYVNGDVTAEDDQALLDAVERRNALKSKVAEQATA